MTYEHWLQSLDEASLASLLHKRLDVALDPPPRTYAALGHLLRRDRSLDAAMRELDVGALSLLVILAGGESMSRSDIGAAVAEGIHCTTSDVDRAVGSLIDLGLCSPVGAGYASIVDDVERLSLHALLEVSQPVLVERGAANVQSQELAVAGFCDLVEAVLVEVDAGSVKAVRAGGVGSREVRTLAKGVGADVDVVELVLGLSGELRLVEARAPLLRCTTEYDEWQSMDRATKYTKFVEAWWWSEGAATNSLQANGKRARILGPIAPNPSTAVLRRRMIDSIPDGGFLDVDSAVDYTVWKLPRFAAEANAGDVAAVWREASALGIIVDGAPTDLSRLLGRLGTTVDATVFAPAVHELVHRAESAVRLLPDLTAVVSGPVSERVSLLLTGAATREARGAASAWRFSDRSIRGWLDRGSSGEELLECLAATASTEMPQSLEYLIRDVVRRHGTITVDGVSGRIESRDAALIAEIHARALFEAERCDDSVLVPSIPTHKVLAALRSAGYAPVLTGDFVPTEVARMEPRPLQPRIVPILPQRTDVGELARALVTGVPAEVDVARLAARVKTVHHLPARDADALAGAIALGTVVTVDVLTAGVGIVKDTIGDILLDSGTLHAWSERLQTRRSIEISNIRMVVTPRL
ncbi:helicase-associated domain-containing protein [Rhodococcus sp. H36-A4]|uniref:helicase-associated domain-containing protein n=1 Tax=Rhodococcus sp. H36-A4 TaxID=3004353 RepID=UPI0022AEB91B|nr:helicase-associated domain-containing protein [Rhodococcus sp. H36-A4]MCZ4077731.1 helicase-associated domain-containing protein [Rhodococcus sp. H36-A4]